MNEFWTNVSRYPRFFISSFAGLILIILAPLKNLFKIKKLRVLLPILIIGIIFGFTFILKEMTAS